MWKLLGENGTRKIKKGWGRTGGWGKGIEVLWSGCLFPGLYWIVNVVVSYLPIAEFSLPSTEERSRALSVLTASHYSVGRCKTLLKYLFVL